MAKLEQLNVTVPAELAEMVRAHVAAGDYASDSELVGEALRVWKEREARLERAFQDIRAKIEESLSDPRPSVPDEEVGRRLEELHARTLKARGDAA